MLTTRRLWLAGALLTTGLVLDGCDTTAVAPTPSNTKVANLTVSPWHITSYTRATGSGAAADYLPTAFPSSCTRDDRYTFKNNGVQERTEGPVSCAGSSGPSTVVGTYPWNFNSSQTQLTIGTVTFDVMQLTADAMELRSSRTSSGVTTVDDVRYEN